MHVLYAAAFELSASAQPDHLVELNSKIPLLNRSCSQVMEVEGWSCSVLPTTAAMQLVSHGGSIRKLNVGGTG